MKDKIMFCPTCVDSWVGESWRVKLDKSDCGKVMYCSGLSGENPCGYHYDLEQQKSFKYVGRKYLWFWAIVCLCSLFTIDRCYVKVYD